MTRAKYILAAVLLLGAGLRFAAARQAPLEIIERDEYLPGAMTLSSDHLPIRMAQHGALPVYLVRASSLLFGESVPGFRMLSVIAGTATILLLYLIAARWWGRLSGLVAAGLLAVERYHVDVSGKAIDLPFDLLFIALAMFSFSRFLHVLGGEAESALQGRWLYATALSSGLGFLCKEFTALMVPVVFLSLLLLRQGAWLKRREPWLALGIFILIISPDLYSNISVTPAQRLDLWNRHQQAALQLGMKVEDEIYQNGLYMSYGDQLSRFRSIGFNATPFYFYFGDLFESLGVARENEFSEFPYMNPLVAALLWCGVGIRLAWPNKDRLTVFLLTMFVAIFLVFTSVRLGAPRGVLATDSDALWYWVDRTMLPALLLTGYGVSVMVQRAALARHGRAVRSGHQA